MSKVKERADTYTITSTPLGNDLSPAQPAGTQLISITQGDLSQAYHTNTSYPTTIRTNLQTALPCTDPDKLNMKAMIRNHLHADKKHALIRRVLEERAGR